MSLQYGKVKSEVDFTTKWGCLESLESAFYRLGYFAVFRIFLEAFVQVV